MPVCRSCKDTSVQKVIQSRHTLGGLFYNKYKFDIYSNKNWALFWKVSPTRLKEAEATFWLLLLLFTCFLEHKIRASSWIASTRKLLKQKLIKAQHKICETRTNWPKEWSNCQKTITTVSEWRTSKFIHQLPSWQPMFKVLVFAKGIRYKVKRDKKN